MCVSLRKIRTKHEFFTFLDSDLHLAQMTLGESHDTLSGHKQSFYELKTYNVSLQEKYGPDPNFAQTDRQGDSFITPPPLTSFLR